MGIGRTRGDRCQPFRRLEGRGVVGHRAAWREVEAEIVGRKVGDLDAMVGDDSLEDAALGRGVDVVGRMRALVAVGKLVPGRAALGRDRHVLDGEETGLSGGEGRGLQPRWLVAALKRGKKLESFVIK